MGIISNQLAKKEDNPLARQSKELIKKVYAQDDRPWVIGYSGGKDSTLTVQLIFEALLEMLPEQWHKKVYVISSDNGKNILVEYYWQRIPNTQSNV